MQFMEMIIIGIVLYVFCMPVILVVAPHLFGKKKVYSDKNPDINKRMRGLRIKTAKLQKPPHCKNLVLVGDNKKIENILGRVVGVVEDRRCMEIAFKTKMFSFSKLLIVPNELLDSSTLAKNLIVRANGIKPVSIGLWFVPVLREEDVHDEEKYRGIISDYWNNILYTDETYLIMERTFHNIITAPGASKIDTSVLLQSESEVNLPNGDGQQ